MAKFDIRTWVEENPEQRPFRQAVHIILTAISSDSHLQACMDMKGGILLALEYQSTRFTKDIDFSMAIKPEDFDSDGFREQFERALLTAVEQLDYGLDCLVQGWKQEPPGEDKSFPTMRMRVGYAEKGNINAHKRLLLGKSTQIVSVDFSLNEPTKDVHLFEIEDEKSIRVYSFHELVGEKFRALLQQEKRHRFRPQDVHDLYFLLEDHPLRDDPITKAKILSSLKEKSAARNLEVEKESMRNPEIIHRTKADYRHLASQIEGDLLPFEKVYTNVQAFYEDLPWNSQDDIRRTPP